MAKRFTDTEKWKKPFLRNLKAPYKLLWFYILDECDPAGLWQVDIEVARLKIGERVNIETAIQCLGDKIRIVDGGEKWFIPSFIEFQYGQLSDNNRAHTKAIFVLKKLGLLNEDNSIKPLTSPLQGAKDMVEEKEEAEEEAEEEGATFLNQSSGVENYLVMPWPTDSFSAAWKRWKAYKREQHKFTFKGNHGEQAALIALSQLAAGSEQVALAIIQQSIANGWKGLFKLKDDHNVQSNSNNGKQPTGANVDSASAFSKIAALAGGN